MREQRKLTCAPMLVWIAMFQYYTLNKVYMQLIRIIYRRLWFIKHCKLKNHETFNNTGTDYTSTHDELYK